MKRPRLSSRLSAVQYLQFEPLCRGSFEKAPPSPHGASRRRVPARSRLSASGQRVLHGHFWEKRRLRSREKRRVDRAVGARQSRLGPSGTAPVVHTVQIMRVRSVSRCLSPRRLRTNEATRAANASHPRSCSADRRFIARIPFPVPADHETFRRAGDGCARGGQARGARGPDERQGADEGFVEGLRAAPARCERGGRATAPTRQGTARGAETDRAVEGTSHGGGPARDSRKSLVVSHPRVAERDESSADTNADTNATPSLTSPRLNEIP